MAGIENQIDRIAAQMAHEPANDSHDVWTRLTDFARRGTDAPETLTPYEIRQVSFALSLFIATSRKT